MRIEYVHAIEQRMAWLRYVKSQQGRHELRDFGKIVDTYQDILETADSYYMSPHFCTLVDRARREVPDSLTWNDIWMQSKRGFLWAAEPFLVPDVAADINIHETDVMLRAVGWREIPAGELLYSRDGAEPQRAPTGCYQFCCFVDVAWMDEQRGLPVTGPKFWPYAYFTVVEGDNVLDRIHELEAKGYVIGSAGYIHRESRPMSQLHEVRWVYAAMHLMSRRLATTVSHPTDRATRRRAERAGQAAPPVVRVITLRRYEEDRKRAGVPEHDVDWQWQWAVSGHWRKQWYPAEGVHKDVWIDEYIKGPEDKPLKPGALKLFSASR